MNGPDALDVVLMFAAVLLVLAIFLGVMLRMPRKQRPPEEQSEGVDTLVENVSELSPGGDGDGD